MGSSGNGCRRRWRSAAAVLGVVCLLGLVACGGGNQKEASADIVTQKVTDKERTPITVMVKYAFSINGFEEALEKKFPQIDLIQVGNFAREMGIDEYERRLEHDDLTDIVMTWPLYVGAEYWKDRLLDLSGYDFTNRYNLSMLNAISQEGKLYYLPGPAQVRGIVYNKTLFQEKGWEVPADYEGFIQLCQTIEASGMRALQLGFQNAEVLDTAFIGYNYANSFSKPQDSQWIQEYNEGKGSFGDHFGPALDVFSDMIDAGIWQASDLDVSYADRETMLFTRQCAMMEDSVLAARMGQQLTGSTDEFALMPFFNPTEDSDWARLYMVCYIGANRHLAEPQNKEKLELVLQVMEYISSPEGQAALASDTGAMFSSLVGVEPPHVPEIQNLLDALRHGRYAIFPQLKNAQDALRQGLAGMLRGEATKEDVIEMVDAENQSPSAVAQAETLGKATADFSIMETGNYVADTMKAWSGCEIALFLDNGKDGLYNGKGISGRIYKGEVTNVDISCVLPDLKHGEDGVVWKITMTGSDLKNALEYTLPVDNNRSGWFYYFSGLRVDYDPVAAPGTRIAKITMADGSPLDDGREYSVAVMDDTVLEEYIVNCTKTNTTVADVVMQGIRGEGTISPSNDGRFTVVVK